MTSARPLAPLLDAFPAVLADDVQYALDTLPSLSTACPDRAVVSAHGLDGPSTSANIRVQDEHVTIPARVYLDVVAPSSVAALPDVQQAIIGCIYTRHHHGFTRQRWLRRLLTHEHAWVVPFVVQLAGEYVVEIAVDIALGLPDLADPTSSDSARYGVFLANNPNFWDLTRQRAASYWNCYHRGRYLSRQHYPVFTLIDRLERARRASATSGHARNRPPSARPFMISSRDQAPSE